jgi:acyl-coenzyme A thioesterase PaaI-like protein
MTPPKVPDAFSAVLAGLEEQQRPPDSDAFAKCFGCGPRHPDGLFVRAFRTDTGVLSPIVVSRRYEGPPGAVHGGIVAAYMDEILGAAAYRGTGKASVTGELTVRYVAPAPLEAPLLGRGHMVTDHGRYIDVEGTIEQLSDGRVVARARGRFFPVAGGETPD